MMVFVGELDITDDELLLICDSLARDITRYDSWENMQSLAGSDIARQYKQKSVACRALLLKLRLAIARSRTM